MLAYKINLMHAEENTLKYLHIRYNKNAYRGVDNNCSDGYCTLLSDNIRFCVWH